jgi:hypothetical protein
MTYRVMISNATGRFSVWVKDDAGLPRIGEYLQFNNFYVKIESIVRKVLGQEKTTARVSYYEVAATLTDGKIID